jgi:hypothetical protein
MDNAVQEFNYMRLFNDVNNLMTKTDLLNTQFAKEVASCNTILRNMYDRVARVEKYLSYHKHK